MLLFLLQSPISVSGSTFFKHLIPTILLLPLLFCSSFFVSTYKWNRHMYSEGYWVVRLTAPIWEDGIATVIWPTKWKWKRWRRRENRPFQVGCRLEKLSCNVKIKYAPLSHCNRVWICFNCTPLPHNLSKVRKFSSVLQICLVACYATLHPALSVRPLVTLYFLRCILASL